MKIKIRKNAVIFLAGALCAVAAEAKTLIWYHFNEGAVGDTTTSPGEKTIVNAAETGSVYDGRVWTCPATGTTSNRSMSATSEYVGTYAEGFPTSVRVIDPQTGVAFTNERSLHLGSATRNGYGKSVIVTVDDAAELHASSFTVEAFVKFDDQQDTSGSWRTIAMKQTDAINGRCSWGLRVGGEGGLMSQTDGRNATNGFDTTQANVSSPSLFDGKWHHVAMVVDGEAMTQTIYQDYRLIKTATLLHPVDYTGDDPIVIGNTIYANYGCFGGGWIDEFRLSDTALSPKDFLHFRTRPDELVDDDTVVYLTFDAYSWFGGAYLHNEAWGPVSTNATLYVNGSATLEDDAVPGEGAIRNGVFGDEVANLGAFHFRTNTAEKKSGIVVVDDVSRMMTTSNFTFEAFYRWKEKHSSGTHYPFGEHGQKGQAIIAAMNTSGSLTVSVQTMAWSNLVDDVTGAVTNTDSYAPVVTLAKNYAGLVDDKWHHLALVRDFDARTVKFYIDYSLVGSASEVTNLYVLPVSGALGGNKYNNNFLIGGAYGTGSSYQMNNGYLDEIRFTKRALAAQEFLMRDAKPDFSGNTLAWFSFEEDYLPEPRAESRKVSVSSSAAREAEVPGGPHTIITDGYGNELRHGNAYSLKLTKGKEAFHMSRDLALENHEEITVEFFAKGTAANKYANVVFFGGTRAGYEDAATDKNNATLWAVQTAYTNRLYRTHVVSTKTSSNGTAVTGTSDEFVTIDGKWHHVAATFGKNASANKTPVNIYYDYKLADTGSVSGFLRTNLVDSVLSVGGGITGWIDEIRISKGVLPTDAFLRRQTLGLVILFK